MGWICQPAPVSSYRCRVKEIDCQETERNKGGEQLTLNNSFSQLALSILSIKCIYVHRHLMESGVYMLTPVRQVRLMSLGWSS